MHQLVLYKHNDENLFVDFSEWDAVVGVTSNSYNNKTSEPILILKKIILKKIVCSLLWYKYLKMVKSMSVTHFRR